MWIDPPATISAPEPTEPSTVTSPSVKTIDWPERTGLSSSSEVGFGLGSSLGSSALTGSLRDHAGPAAGQKRRHVAGETVFRNTLDAEDANAALLEAADEMADRGRAEVDGRKIEHNGLADEVTRRARQRGVDLVQPVHDRHHGAEYERDIGTPA